LGSRCEEAGFDLVVNFACHDLAALGTANLQNTSAGCVPHQRLNIPAALRRVAEIVELVIIESSDSPPHCCCALYSMGSRRLTVLLGQLSISVMTPKRPEGCHTISSENK